MRVVLHRYCRLIKTLLLHRISVADLLSNYMHNYPCIDSVMFGVLIAIRYIFIYLFIGHCQFSNDTFFFTLLEQRGKAVTIYRLSIVWRGGALK